MNKSSDSDYKETTEDIQKSDIGEDSQLEYHSAEEQEYISSHLSFDQAKTLSISNLKVIELRNSGYKVKCASNQEDSHVNLESGSIISLDSLDVYGQEDSPHVSKFQNSVMLRECHEHEKCKEQETSLMYHTISEESQYKSGFLNPPKTLKAKISTEKVNFQKAESKDSYGNCENKILKQLENPSTLSQDKALETLVKPYKDCQTSWTSIFDDSVISACGYSHYKSLQNTPCRALDFSVTLPGSVVRDNQSIGEDTYLKIANATNKTCFHNMEGTCPKLETDATNTVTINQTVDVSTDFRACFTTSRATNTSSAVVSTSSNTEITMMNKKRPGRWQSEKQRSVACNTDLSYSCDCVNIQVAVTKGPGKPLSLDSLKPNGNFTNKESLLSDSSHPKQDISPKKDNFKNGDINVDFSQLKLDDKDYRNYQEISEDWFDAKENLTGLDFLGIQENEIDKDRWNHQCTLAHHLFAVTACQDADFGTLAQEHCLARFESDMEAVGEPLWCDWAKTIGSHVRSERRALLLTPSSSIMPAESVLTVQSSK
ncbi:RNA-binding protein 44 [Tupaia chinensis]|uniref:RNA-binding protein 44 n=1 Tax=Tupaia chinensis TaxID=246437 RepID=L9KM55_TUPCH|nr:RNA-binding protein 44 [Tupaia chinensis]